MVGASGFEPPTPTMSRWCSNQLSYAPANQVGYSTLQDIIINAFIDLFLVESAKFWHKKKRPLKEAVLNRYKSYRVLISQFLNTHHLQDIFFI